MSRRRAWRAAAREADQTAALGQGQAQFVNLFGPERASDMQLAENKAFGEKRSAELGVDSPQIRHLTDQERFAIAQVNARQALQGGGENPFLDAFKRSKRPAKKTFTAPKRVFSAV